MGLGAELGSRGLDGRFCILYCFVASGHLFTVCFITSSLNSATRRAAHVHEPRRAVDGRRQAEGLPLGSAPRYGGGAARRGSGSGVGGAGRPRSWLPPLHGHGPESCPRTPPARLRLHCSPPVSRVPRVVFSGPLRRRVSLVVFSFWLVVCLARRTASLKRSRSQPAPGRRTRMEMSLIW